MIRLLLVDDQDLIRRGMRALLKSDPGLQVVGEAANGQEAIAQVAALNPDVVLLDVRMPVMDGVAATQAIGQQFPQTKILILTTFDDQEYVTQAMRYGASGYLLKDTPFEGIDPSDSPNSQRLHPARARLGEGDRPASCCSRD